MLFKERKFIRCAFAAQHRVTVRKAAKAINDVAMLDGVAERFFEGQGTEQHDGMALVCRHLGMLERHVQKEPLVGRELIVEPGINGLASNAERQVVGGESTRRSTVDVAWELVE